MKVKNITHKRVSLGNGRWLEPGKTADVKKDAADWENCTTLEVVKSVKKANPGD